MQLVQDAKQVRESGDDDEALSVATSSDAVIDSQCCSFLHVYITCTSISIVCFLFSGFIDGRNSRGGRPRWDPKRWRNVTETSRQVRKCLLLLKFREGTILQNVRNFQESVYHCSTVCFEVSARRRFTPFRHRCRQVHAFTAERPTSALFAALQTSWRHFWWFAE